MRLRVLVKKIISQHNLAGASVRHRIANPLELLSSSLIKETVARQRSHHPRPAFHSISHSARVWFLGGLVFSRIAVAVVVLCVEPRGPASHIGVLGIQMTAVMRRDSALRNRPHRRSSSGAGERTAWSMPTVYHPSAAFFLTKKHTKALLFRLRFCAKPRNRSRTTIEHYTLPVRLRARVSAGIFLVY